MYKQGKISSFFFTVILIKDLEVMTFNVYPTKDRPYNISIAQSMFMLVKIRFF